MGEFKMSGNSSGYYDETAYKAISGAAKSGEVWEYSNNYGTNQTFLIIKNHGNICTALRLVDEPTAECVEVYEMHTDPRMLQYIYNTNLARYVHSLSAGEFRSILDTISECLNIKIEAKTPTDGAEKAKPQAKEAVNQRKARSATLRILLHAERKKKEEKNMSILGHLEPANVFHFFEEICNIPHGSGNIDKIPLGQLLRLFPAGHTHHSDPFRQELLGTGQADAAGSAGYDGYFLHF